MKRLLLLAVLLAISLCSAASAAPDIDFDLYFLSVYTTSEDKTTEAQKIFPNCVRAAVVHDSYVISPTPIYVSIPYVGLDTAYNVNLYLQNKNGSFDCVFGKNNITFHHGRVYDVSADSEYNLGTVKNTVYAVLCVDLVDLTLPLLELKSQQYTDGNPLPSLASVEPYRTFSLGFNVKNFEKYTVSGKTSGKINSSSALINGNGEMSVSSFLAAGQNGIITIAAENAEGKRASFDIVLSADTSVPHIPVTGIKVKDSSDPSSIPAGEIALTLSGDIAEQRKVEAVLVPESATYKYVTWSSDKPKVASVDQDGTISALRAGTATITAETRDGGHKATCEVTVEKSDIFVLDPITLSLAVGEEKKVTTFLKFETSLWHYVTWEIADPETVMEVESWDDYCIVRGLREGSTQLTATTIGPDGETLTATCDITVSQVVPSSIVLDPAALSLGVGEEKTTTASLEFTPLPSYFVTWKIADSGTAMVVDSQNDYCIVRGLREGSTQLTATTTGPDGETLTATCDITVKDTADPSVTIDLSGLGLYNDTMEVLEGDTVDLWISGTPSDLSFSADRLPQGLTLSSQGHLFGTILAQAEGDDSPRYYPVTIVANSPSGESGTESFTITVWSQGESEPDDKKSDGGSGGCNAGVAGLALSLAGLLCLKKRIGR